MTKLQWAMLRYWGWVALYMGGIAALAYWFMEIAFTK